MSRVLGTFFALLFLVWGVLTVIGGIGEGRVDWAVLGVVLGGFGALFLPAVRLLWRSEGI